MDILNYNRK